MKLGDIRNYIKRRGDSTLADVAIHFDISKEAAKFAIEYWIKKGKVQAQGAACGSSCGGCGSASETYQWVKNEQPIQWLS
jgi:predicted ArsR family transcriptional regulator